MINAPSRSRKRLATQRRTFPSGGIKSTVPRLSAAASPGWKRRRGQHLPRGEGGEPSGGSGAVAQGSAWRFARVGPEAGALPQWLFSGLVEAGLPAICIETRHTKAFLKAQVKKSDRNDARSSRSLCCASVAFIAVPVRIAASAGILRENASPR